jgi:hypothetical protein
VRERARHDLGLLMDFLRHEVAVIAALDEQRAGDGALLHALDDVAVLVMEFGEAGTQHDPVAVFEIGDDLGEGRERQRVGAEIHILGAPADGERRPLPGADQEVVDALEQKGKGKSAFEPREGSGDSIDRIQPLAHLRGDEMGDDLGVGLGREGEALTSQFLTQLAKILDNAVMNDGKPVARMRMRVGFARSAVRRPPRVADADHALQWRFRQPQFEVLELALGPPARQVATFERRDTGRVVAAIFEPLQSLDDRIGDRRAPQNSDDPAHGPLTYARSLRPYGCRGSPWPSPVSRPAARARAPARQARHPR